MLYGHVHNTREWELIEKWKKEQWAMGIPSRLINVSCIIEYMRYTPRTLTELPPIRCRRSPELAKMAVQLKAQNRGTSRKECGGRMKVTPLKKQSKKSQRKFHVAKRGTWNGVSPVTHIVQSKRLYDRNRAKQEARRDADR